MPKQALRAAAVTAAVALLVTGCTGGSNGGLSTASSASSPSSAASSGPSSSASTGSSSSTVSSVSASSITATSASATTSSAAPTTGAPEITPVLARVDDRPVPVTGTDGAIHLAYELYLTNITSSPVTVGSVQAVDSASGATLQTLSGDDLLANARVVGTAPGGAAPTSVVLNGGQLAIVWLAPDVPGGSTVPEALLHKVELSFAEAPSPLIPAELTEDVAPVGVDTTPAPVISPPLDGENWFDGNGCCDTVTPHRGASNPIDGQYLFAERFAIDWVQLTAQDTLFTGPATELSSYAYYGSPIHAVADGEIVAVSDDLQDEPPGANPPVGSLLLDQFGGNHVVQRFEQNGRTYYAFYAHLKPGSATAAVRVGQQVTAGQQVGELGNSGNTDAPHLHFHVMDGPDPLASNGLPFAFDRQQLTGRAAGEDALNGLFTGAALTLADGVPTGERTEEMPLYLDVVDLTAATPAGSGSGASSSGAPGSGEASSTTTPAPSPTG